MKSIFISQSAAVRKLGEGSYGYVYLMQGPIYKSDGSLYLKNGLFALKEPFNQNKADVDAEASQHFHIWSNLGRDCRKYFPEPYVVRDSSTHLAMRYVEDERLVPVTKNSVEKVRAALRCLHRIGCTHNDLHEGNFLIDSKGNVKLIDFGMTVCTHSPLQNVANSRIHASWMRKHAAKTKSGKSNGLWFTYTSRKGGKKQIVDKAQFLKLNPFQRARFERLIGYSKMVNGPARSASVNSSVESLERNMRRMHMNGSKRSPGQQRYFLPTGLLNSPNNVSTRHRSPARVNNPMYFLPSGLLS